MPDRPSPPPLGGDGDASPDGQPAAPDASDDAKHAGPSRRERDQSGTLVTESKTPV